MIREGNDRGRGRGRGDMNNNLVTSFISHISYLFVIAGAELKIKSYVHSPY